MPVGMPLSLRSALGMSAHGFEEERFGTHQPPVTHYHLRDAASGFYAEFLTPLFGPEHGRDRKLKATRRIAGIVSQQLRYLEILLVNPWTVRLARSNGFPLRDPKELRIPNPTHLSFTQSLAVLRLATSRLLFSPLRDLSRPSG